MHTNYLYTWKIIEKVENKSGKSIIDAIDHLTHFEISFDVVLRQQASKAFKGAVVPFETDGCSSWKENQTWS